MKLRVGCFASALLVWSELIPLLPREYVGKPQAGKDDKSARHAGDTANERSNGWCSSRNARGDGESGRGIALPSLGKSMEQPVAPLGKIHFSALAKELRPRFVNEF